MTSTIPYGGAAERVGDLEVVPVFDGYSREDPTRFYVTHVDAAYERGHRREDGRSSPICSTATGSSNTESVDS